MLRRDIEIMFLMRRQGETHRQYQDRLIKHIEHLREANAELSIQISQLEESKNVVHIDTLKARDDRINALVEKLKRIGCWQGE